MISKGIRFGLSALLVLSLFGVSNANEKVTIVADNSYPPYSFIEDGDLLGIYPDILRAADERLDGYQINLIPLPWKRALRETEKGTAFGLLPPYYRPGERPFISRYSVPIYAEETILICRKDVFQNTRRIFWPNDFYGLTIAINRGFAVIDESVLFKNGEKVMRLESGDGNEVNLMKLTGGRVPCYANDRISIEYGLKNMVAKNKIKARKAKELKFGPVIRKEWGYVAYSRNNNPSFKNDFIEKLDQVILRMQEDKSIEEIVQNYLLKTIN
ncbi:substrate-binding periplasmic protein [Curvivirga aplysinae]|uniref:substrate-binding periplasmic protein n=1 Tax=Curvivirga aplysinae TaxID=2529852 RepID=UPI0012BD5F00|nr:transporter substrate-binding domain-containing protein [Curvivirga aplysinae]MTI10335.1 transporter substrate-binding domain-containing protein [Curvivirga aplysinae]